MPLPKLRTTLFTTFSISSIYWTLLTTFYWLYVATNCIDFLLHHLGTDLDNNYISNGINDL